MSELLSGAQILCRTLVDAGVDVMFGYPGGAIMPFYDALHGHAGLRHILVRHEQAAAHAADGYARAGKRVGVCVATSGPGATNLATGPAAGFLDDDAIQQTAHLITEAERPIMMIGRGVIISGAYAEVRELAERTGMPVITTLLGISAFPQVHDLHLGMPGMHGEVHINKAIQAADLIVGIGLRFDDRVTGNTATFAPRARIVHIDVDAEAIGRNVPVAVGIVGDARPVVERLLSVVDSRA